MTTEAKHWNSDRLISFLRRLIHIGEYLLIGLLIVRFLCILFQFGITSTPFTELDSWISLLRNPFLGWVGQELVRFDWHVDLPSLLAIFAIAVIAEFLQWILHFFYRRRSS